MLGSGKDPDFCPDPRADPGSCFADPWIWVRIQNGVVPYSDPPTIRILRGSGSGSGSDPLIGGSGSRSGTNRIYICTDPDPAWIWHWIFYRILFLCQTGSISVQIWILRGSGIGFFTGSYFYVKPDLYVYRSGSCVDLALDFLLDPISMSVGRHRR